ncbi:twitching motility protein PilT [Vulcanisaeta thermophila]|uniref:twitching motility protein PilT n=1 Tax=Vulcanisaeta thermophila TaxID=867917 RepID=UPI000853AE7E|nr:twitching motility protein PilT [Vulcanisaeta thermophila]
MSSVYILDTSAILHVRNAYALTQLGTLVTTNYVVNELRDARAQVMPEVLGIMVYEVGGDEIRRVRERYHIPRLLSDADVSLIALALKLRDLDPVVVTDDSLLIAFLRRLNIKYRVVFLRRRRQ